MDFYVGIASYKRPEASRTLDYLDSLGFPKERRILSVQTEEDRDAYTRSGLNERVGTFLYREASTAAGNRNTILLNVPEGTNVVFMDDDIKQVVMEDLGLVPLDTLEKFERMCKLGFATAQKNRTICFGLYPVANAYFMRGGYKKAAICVGTLIGMVATPGITFCEELQTKEDYELCCRIIRKYGACIRLDRFACDALHYSKGGCEDAWKDKSGVIRLPEAEKGWYQVVELKAAEGYRLDDTPYQIEVKDGQTATLEITNRQTGSALIHKIDSVTGKGIYGVKFLLSDARGNPIGTYESDNEGYVYIDHELEDGRYTIQEIECAEGYLLETQPKTVYVKYGGCTTIIWENTAVTGQIQVTKTSADYNSMNGWPAGTPIPGTVFEIYHARTGRLVDTIRTDKNGVAVSKPLPLGRYKIVESQAADFYALDKTPIEVEIEHEGQIVKAAMTNKSLYTNVAIQKTGYAEVMPGQNIRYTFSGIANNSTTSLTSFYWRDTLPVEAVRLAKITTGTYNAAGSYKIVYKTNLSGSEYRVLADSLNTQQNYVLDASPVALRLGSNEYVTEVMFVFGVVPSNFRQVETPIIDCSVVSWVKGGSQFVNQADVGGVYDGQWIMATSRWVTKVYAPSKPLPRTGY